MPYTIFVNQRNKNILKVSKSLIAMAKNFWPKCLNLF